MSDITTAKTHDELVLHLGHHIVCVSYGTEEMSLECETCGEVLYSVNAEEPAEPAQCQVRRGKVPY